MTDEKKERNVLLNRKIADATGKNIFKDMDVCSELLNDYVDLPFLPRVRPEDIENISERFTPMFESERDADSVLRIHVPLPDNAEEGKQPGSEPEDPGKDGFFLVALIEHKSYVEYNIGMQIFRYMVCIWEEYEREMELKSSGITKHAGFQYPPIIPIVFYEGKGRWTAKKNFREKIAGESLLGKYVPDFEYYMVGVCGYKVEELLTKGNAMSLIMLILRMQDWQSVHEFLNIPQERLEKMVADAKEQTMQLIHDILLARLLHMNYPPENAEDIASKVRKKKMGLLCQCGDEMDIQLEWKKLKEAKLDLEQNRQDVEQAKQDVEQAKQDVEQAKQDIEQAKQDAEQAKQDAEQAKQDAEQAIKALIEALHSAGFSRNDTLDVLKEKLLLPEDQAEQKLVVYWKIK